MVNHLNPQPTTEISQFPAYNSYANQQAQSQQSNDERQGEFLCQAENQPDTCQQALAKQEHSRQECSCRVFAPLHSRYADHGHESRAYGGTRSRVDQTYTNRTKHFDFLLVKNQR
jgi:hypothetical protein